MSKFTDEKLESTKFEDITSITRGETPQDIVEKCHKLCAEYLGGIWQLIDITKINVWRISGGYTNQLYYCGLNEEIDTIIDEPTEVAVKFYGEKWFKSDERISDIVIGILASNYNLGPKVYGVFNEGEIIEYIKSHQFRYNDQLNDQLVKEVAQKLAKFHSMRVPIPKHNDWFTQNLDKSYDMAFSNFPIDDIIKEVNAEYLTKYNIKDEYKWLIKALKASQSPIVFSHNDFRGSNILVRDVTKDNQSSIILCDFDYSDYYYRGFDLGVCLDEFGRKQMITFEKDLQQDFVDKFVSSYLDEAIKLNGQKYALNPFNSKDHLINECRLFSLASDMFSILFLFSAKEIPFCKNKNDIMVGADKVFAKYLFRKQYFTTLGAIPIV